MARRAKQEPLKLTSDAIDVAKVFMELSEVDREEIKSAVRIRRAAAKRRYAIRAAPREYDSTDALLDSLTLIARVQRESRC